MSLFDDTEIANKGVDAIDPTSDPRVTHEYATLHGRRYHYLLAAPSGGSFSRTVFLVHGWPDISMGWRYQIPLFLSLGCRVVAPDMMGYGRSEAPPVPPNELSLYSMRRAAEDLEELAHQLGEKQVILGGHDWGGAIVYRVCLWKPDLVSHLFSICTPYMKPSGGGGPFVPLAERVERYLPNFRYQLQFASGEVPKLVNTRESISQVLNGIYGGKGPDGEAIFDVSRGIMFENLGKIGASPLMSGREMDYYVDEFCRNGMAGGLNWYKTTQVNWEEERDGLDRTQIAVPTLFVQAARDTALLPWMSKGMEDHIPRLTRREVNTSHWAMLEKPAEVNALLKDWLSDTGAIPSKSSL